MGVVSSVRNCFEQSSTESSKFIDIREKVIYCDYEYFLNQRWYRFQDQILFDPNKFIFLYNAYQQIQQTQLEVWKIVDFKKINIPEKAANDCPLSEQCKYAIRRGVPINHYKSIIQILFQKNPIFITSKKSYQSLLFQNAKKGKNQIQPNSFQKKGVEIFKMPFLNSAGQQALKRITFFITKTSGQLQYSPFLLHLIGILLIFLDESSTFGIARCLIQSSFTANQENKQILKFHLTLNQSQFQKLTERFYKTVKKISPTIKVINNHLNTEGIEKVLIFQQIIGNFFFGYLPFPTILKIFMSYLNEGIEIFFRIYYAILKVSEAGIRDSTNNNRILRSIKAKMLTFLGTEKNNRIFFRYAFDLQLDRAQNMRMLEKQSLRSRKSQDDGAYYLPIVQGSSQILSYDTIEVIWSFLPTALKHYDIRKIYPPDEQSDSLCLKSMVRTMSQCNFTLIIIETLKKQIFGVFMAERIKSQKEIQNNFFKMTQSAPNLFGDLTKNPTMNRSVSTKDKQRLFKDILYFGSTESFVFTLEPHKKKFHSTGQNIFYCSYNDTFFAIGGPAARPALQLNGSLDMGLSFPCPTYNNTPLHNGPQGQFNISKIECFSIQ